MTDRAPSGAIGVVRLRIDLGSSSPLGVAADIGDRTDRMVHGVVHRDASQLSAQPAQAHEHDGLVGVGGPDPRRSLQQRFW